MVTDDVHKSHSVSAIKLFGKKLLKKGDDSSVKSRSTSPNGNRSRSGSLVHRTDTASPRAAHGTTVRNVTRSSANVNELLKHSHNPFIHDNSPTPAPNRYNNNKKHVYLQASNENMKATHKHQQRNTHHFEPHREHSFAMSDKRKAERMVYNPYGMNNNSGRPETLFAGSDKQDISFYMHDGNANIRMLPLPIKSPNEYLPEEMQQSSILLMDNFVFDTDNKPIGSGGSSEVRKVRSLYKQKEIYALKKLNMIYHETPDRFYERCSKEFIIAKHLSKNIHIMRTFYLLKVPTSTYTTRGWGFVMELGVKDLFQLMEKPGWKNVPLNEKYCMFKQIAQGVKFCHDQGVAHRDLKPENVLLSRNGICKLTDFGISDWYHSEPFDFTSPHKITEGMIGSPPYTPPEVMFWDAKKHYPESLQKPYSLINMDPYALGILLTTMLNGIIPFLDSCNKDPRFREYASSYENFINHSNPHFRDKGCYEPGPGPEYSLVRKFQNREVSRVAWRLADPNPETRYTMTDLFNDPWFQGIETCVDPDEDDYTYEPEIRRRTLQDTDVAISGTTVPHPEEDPSTSPISEKPRSMMEIAESPHVKTADNRNKALFTLSESTDDTEELTQSAKFESGTQTHEGAHAEPNLKRSDSNASRLSGRSDVMSLSRTVTQMSLSQRNSSTTSLNKSTGSHGPVMTNGKKLIHNHLELPAALG